jgi:hypothetical protein
MTDSHELMMGTTQCQDLEVVWWPVEKPTPYARNPREAPEAAIAKVAASLQEFGFRQPIVVDEEHVVIAGHTRLLAAKRLGLEMVPAHALRRRSYPATTSSPRRTPHQEPPANRSRRPP